MKIVLVKYYKDLKYEEVPKHFEGDLEYVADADCGNYVPYAIWRNHNPNRDKGHKDYLLIYKSDGVLYVAGRDKKDMKKWLKRDAVRCLNCGDIIYSMYRHNMQSCSCSKLAIDGGQEYCKVSFDPTTDFESGTLNLETKKFTKSKKKT